MTALRQLVLLTLPAVFACASVARPLAAQSDATADSTVVLTALRDSLRQLTSGARIRLTHGGMGTLTEHEVRSVAADSLKLLLFNRRYLDSLHVREVAAVDTIHVMTGRKRHGIRRGAVRGFLWGAAAGAVLFGVVLSDEDQAYWGGTLGSAAVGAALYSVPGAVLGALAGTRSVEQWRPLWIGRRIASTR